MKKTIFFILVFGCSIYGTLSPTVMASETLTISVLVPSSINQAVGFISKGGYNPVLRLVCVNASSDTVIDKLFSENFNLGNSINVWRTRIGKKMQDEIDAYQEIHTVFTSAAYNNSPAVITAGLDGGI